MTKRRIGTPPTDQYPRLTREPLSVSGVSGIACGSCGTVSDRHRITHSKYPEPDGPNKRWQCRACGKPFVKRRPEFDLRN